MSGKHELEEQIIAPAKKTKKEIQAEEREAARIQREAEKLARKQLQEKQKQERELQRENERKEREQAKLEREKEKERLKKEKEREREQAKLEKEREKERQREEKERQKELLKEQKEKELQAQQPRLNTFFSVRQKKEDPVVAEEQKSEYHSTFLPYHHKATCTVFLDVVKPEDPTESCVDWLKAQSRPRAGPYISTAAFKKGLEVGHQVEKLMGQLQVKHIQFYETIRPAFVGTTVDLDAAALRRLCLDATQPLLETVDYDYDSDLEWSPGDEDDEDLVEDEQSEDDGSGSDVDSFLASDDEGESFDRRKVVMAVDPTIKWNDGTDPDFFAQFKAISLEPAPIKLGEYAIPQAPKPAAAPKPELPASAISEILRGIQGREGTKTLLLETLWHDLHTKFATLTRSSLKSLIDSHAKKEKNQWVVLQEKMHLMESS